MIAPKPDDPNTKEVDGRTYYFCKKCRQGEGLWALHKEEEHKGRSNKRTTTVSFTSDTKKDDGPSQSKEDASKESTSSAAPKPALKVSKDLISNAKSYLAHFEDFPKGGV